MTQLVTPTPLDRLAANAAYIIVDDVDAYFREIRSRGVAVLKPSEDSPWGTREMSVMDPDGNRLRFATARQ